MVARQLAWLALVALLVAGCFAKVRNLPALSGGPAFEEIPEARPDLLVGLAISGGGSRAATFATGVLEALARIPVRTAGGEQSVLEMVQYISSVSGGSLATGYFAARKPPRSEPMLSGRTLSPAYEAFFKAYKAAMQEDFERPALFRQLLLFRGLNPTQVAYSLAEVWDDRFLHQMTFTDLYAREKTGDSPRIILNGTSYNSGQRFAFTTLPAVDFDYDFVGLLLDSLKQRGDNLTAEGVAIIEQNLQTAKNQFLPLTFEQIGADQRDLPLSLGIVSSASFPPAVGPVTYSVGGQRPYQHVGDGGLFDNLGTESLTTLFLKKIPRGSPKRGLIIVIDAAFPFDAHRAFLDGTRKGFTVFHGGSFANRGHHGGARQRLPTDAVGCAAHRAGRAAGDFANLRIEVLRHTGLDWGGYADLPVECRDEFPTDVKSEAIGEAVGRIPTLFRVTKCHGALLIKAAQKVVEKHRGRIVEFLERGS